MKSPMFSIIFYFMLYVYIICLSGLGIVKKPIYFPQLCGCINTKLTIFSLLVLTAILIVFPDFVCVYFQALLRTILGLLVLLYNLMRCLSVCQGFFVYYQNPDGIKYSFTMYQLVSGSQTGL